MSSKLTAAGALVALAISSWAVSAFAAPPPMAFGRREAIQNVAISPDGHKVALISGTESQRSLSISTIDQPNPVVLNLGDVRTSGLRWGGNDHILVRVTVYEKPTGWKYAFNFTRDLIFDTNGKLKTWLLSNSAESSFMTGLPIYKIVHDTDKPFAIVRGLDQNRKAASNNTRFAEDHNVLASALWKVDISTGRGSVIERDPGEAYAIDSDGQLRGKLDEVRSVNDRVRLDERAYTVFGRGKGDSNWKSMVTVKGRGVGLLGYSAADDSLYWVQEDGPRGSQRIHKVSFKDGATSVVPVPDEAVDVDMTFDPDTDQPLNITYTTGDDLHYEWLDPKFKSAQASLDRLFKNKNVDIVDWSMDRSRFIVRVWSPNLPTSWYLYDPGRKEVSALGDEYPELKDAALGTKTFFTYKARDGLSIPAYLHMPPGKVDKGLPLIVLPHGGPEARDDGEFDWWAQFLASRGYAVLQPQFRGSGGFGFDFREAGRQEWAGKMQTDLVDGITDLAAKGVVDPKRVCIVGASYGGYAALYGMTSLPDTYKCGISVNGVADPGLLVAQMKSRYGEEETLLLDIFGDNRQEVAAGSPLQNAAKVRAPVLLVYSALDTTVPPDQTTIMAERLKQGGKPVTVVQLQGDDHYLNSSSSRIQMLSAMDTFLAANLPVTP